MSRRTVADEVAIVGLGRYAYSKGSNSTVTAGEMALRACVDALRDSSLHRDEIDGVCGTSWGVSPFYVQRGLGIETVSWFSSPEPPVGNQLVGAVNAIVAGTCNAVLLFHTVQRLPGRSRSAAADPWRQRADIGHKDYRAFFGTGHNELEPLGSFGEVAFALWSDRYLHQSAATREDFGRIAINSRSHAVDNPNAVIRDPMTMESYLAARSVREPLGLFDMEIPVDCADAFVLVPAERARDIDHPVVTVHAQALGVSGSALIESQAPDLADDAQAHVMRTLWRQSDAGIQDVDLVLAYDGFTLMAMQWLDHAGWCLPGESPYMVRESFDDSTGRILLAGKVPVNTHGGSLSEGGSQGTGQLYEAVSQLRGTAGPRQVSSCRTVLMQTGGGFFNAQAFVLRGEANPPAQARD